MLSKIYSYIMGGSQSHSYESLTLHGTLTKKSISKPLVIIYEEAVLGLKITKEATNEYYLVINQYEMLFPISTELHLKTFIDQENRNCFMWENMKCFYIFTLNDYLSPYKNQSEFYSAICALITSVEYNITIGVANDDENKYDFLITYEHIEDIDDFIEKNYSEIDNSNIDEFTKEINDLQLDTPQIRFLDKYPKSKALFTAKGTFYEFDCEKDDFELLASNATFTLYHNKQYSVHIVINGYSYGKINKQANVWYRNKDKIFMWLRKKKNKTDDAMSFEFDKNCNYDQLKEMMPVINYEANAQKPFSELSPEDQEWILNDNRHTDKLSSNESSIEIQDEMNQSGFDIDFSRSEDSDRKHITSLQTCLFDRTFVIKEDNSISLYKTNSKNFTLKHMMEFPCVTSSEIAGGILYKSDRNLLLRDNAYQGNQLYQFDIESQKIISQWSTGTDINSITAICSEKKNDQVTDNNIVLGINDCNLFIFDGRLNKENKVVSNKPYKSDVKFNCLATDENGNVAIGSHSGEVRFYQDAEHRAKILYPCFGDEIKGIDITLNGKYILATCEKYLLVIPTETIEKKSSVRKSFVQDKKNHLYQTLTLCPTHIAQLNLGDYSFTKANFDNNQNEEESQIISSINEYLIIWNFSQVKKGVLDQYFIKKMDQNVLQNQFKFNKPHIVVTTPNTLCIQAHK